MLETIVVPLDGSALAARALPYARALAGRAHGTLVLVRALPGQDADAAQAEAKLGRAAEPLRAEGLTVEADISYDPPVQAINEAVRSRGAGLIVMSTHGRSGLGRWLYGSVADQVLRQAAAPVLLIPPGCPDAWPQGRPLRLLVTLDGSTLAEQALPPAREVARAVGASEVALLRVVEPPNYSAYGAAEAYAYLPVDIEAELAEAGDYLRQLAGTLEGGAAHLELLTAQGRPAASIVETARERGSDLIAMATHGRGGLARLVLGSVATEVLQTARVPLLLCPPAGVREEAPTPASSTMLALSPSEVAVLRRALANLPGDDAARALLARLG